LKAMQICMGRQGPDQCGHLLALASLCCGQFLSIV